MNTPDVEKYITEWKEIAADVFKGRLSPLYADEWLTKTLTTAIEEAREERDREIVKIIHDELRNAPLAEQMSKGVIFANVINRITNHD